MDMKLELVPVPVSDVDASKDFYVDKLGFRIDHDVWSSDGRLRVVQLTPPGSACSIVFGIGVPGVDMQPGSMRRLHLVVEDIAQAQQTLSDRGVEVSQIDEHARGIKYAYFSDPDGNTWALQEIPGHDS